MMFPDSAIARNFVTVCDYLIARLPLQDEVLKRAEAADISLTLPTSAKSADLVFFVNTFPALMPAGSTHDSLLEAFAEIQCTTIDDCVCDRMDLSWKALSNKKNGGGVKPFQALASVMLGILTIPHSSAHCERVFSSHGTQFTHV